MVTSLLYLFGKLQATVGALKIEGEYLESQDRDAHNRLAKLLVRLDAVVAEIGDCDLQPTPLAPPGP
jgi:hypothetical protein